MIKRITYKRVPKSTGYLSTNGIGRADHDVRIEELGGSVQGLPASAIEERAARSIQKNRKPFQFRLALGEGRNLPGWKELDFLVDNGGIYYAIEIDTEFTHRLKQNADVLHDAIVLSELKGMTVYPQVIHVDGNKDLATQEDSDRYFRSIL